MDVSIDTIRELRARTGAGVVDAKTALVETGGDIEKAINVLRERGKIKAAKKSERATGEGAIGVYLHGTKKVATLVSVRCETDFVARSSSFQDFIKDLAIHVAAMDPQAVQPEDLSGVLGQEERKHRALLTQPFVKDPERTVGELLTDKITELGEHLVVEKFVRMTL